MHEKTLWYGLKEESTSTLVLSRTSNQYNAQIARKVLAKDATDQWLDCKATCQMDIEKSN